MVIVVMLGIIFRKNILPTDVFAYALLTILLLDPLVTLSIGFWLSFVAVGLLLYVFVGRKVISRFDKWFKPHIVIFIGMMPLCLVNFNTISIVSPL